MYIDTFPETALMIGAKVGYFEMLKAYREAGTKIDWVDGNGNTLLHIAAQYSEKYNSDLDDVKQRITGNFISFVSLSIELGLDPYQKNNIGETAIDIAIR